MILLGGGFLIFKALISGAVALGIYLLCPCCSNAMKSSRNIHESNHQTSVVLVPKYFYIMKATFSRADSAQRYSEKLNKHFRKIYGDNSRLAVPCDNNDLSKPFAVKIYMLGLG